MPRKSRLLLVGEIWPFFLGMALVLPAVQLGGLSAVTWLSLEPQGWQLLSEDRSGPLTSREIGAHGEMEPAPSESPQMAASCHPGGPDELEIREVWDLQAEQAK